MRKPSDDHAESNAATNGGIGGLLAGVNWQNGAFVYGLEADFGWSNAHGSGIAPPPAAPPVIFVPNQYTINWTTDLRGLG